MSNKIKYRRTVTDLILTICFSAFTLVTFGQTFFTDGFIINMKNDTIHGQIAMRNANNNLQSCIFKKGEVERVYTPKKIKAYGYANRLYKSGIIDDAFVEVLVLGKIDLYKSSDKFFLRKDTTIYTLEEIYEEVNIDGKTGKRESSNWRGITAFLISDCIESPHSLVAGSKLTDRKITNAILRYNICTGAEYKEFKDMEPWIKYSPGIGLGFARTSIIVPDVWIYSGLDRKYSSYDPSIGVFLNISAPRLSNRISIQSELHLIRSDFSSLVILDWESRHDYYESYINTTSLFIPLSFKYTYPYNANGYYFQTGFLFYYHFNRNAIVRTEIISNNVVNTMPDREFSINKYQLGYWAGLGKTNSFKKFKAEIAIRYYSMIRFIGAGETTPKSNQISLNIIFSKL